MKQTIKTLFVGLLLTVSVVTINPPVTGAVEGCDPAKESCDQPCGVATAVITCPDAGTSTDSNNGILSLLVIALQIMTAGVGIVAVGGLIYGGVLYASAGPSPDRVKKSIEVIRNVIIGVVAYGAMYALLNFLIPGGVFR